jgi:hypothetical protein
MNKHSSFFDTFINYEEQSYITLTQVSTLQKKCFSESLTMGKSELECFFMECF